RINFHFHLLVAIFVLSFIVRLVVFGALEHLIGCVLADLFLDGGAGGGRDLVDGGHFLVFFFLVFILVLCPGGGCRASNKRKCHQYGNHPFCLHDCPLGCS